MVHGKIVHFHKSTIIYTRKNIYVHSTMMQNGLMYILGY